MTSSFIECRLGDVLTLQRGFDLPATARKPGLVPVVSSSGVTGTHDEARVSAPGVVIGRYGTLGEVHYVTVDFWPLNTSLYVKDFKGNHPLFCAYLLKTVGVESTSAAAAVPGVNRNVLHELQVRLPGLETQRRIASVLGAYDELIKVNRRRIAVLEETTRRLFEEWFVNFRFPGHLPAADRPDKWPAGTAADLIDFDPPTPLPRATSKPFIPMTHLSTATSLIDSPEWREAGSGAKFRNDDTLFARITPCLENGKTGLVRDLPGDGVGCGSTEYIVMRGRVAGPAFTYQLARHDAFRAHARRSMTGASGRQRARTESVRGFPVAVPPASLLATFEAQAWPMLQLVGRLGESNKRLAASRDLLLPRLISGDLPVAAAERELEAVA